MVEMSSRQWKKVWFVLTSTRKRCLLVTWVGQLLLAIPYDLIALKLLLPHAGIIDDPVGKLIIVLGIATVTALLWTEWSSFVTKHGDYWIRWTHSS